MSFSEEQTASIKERRLRQIVQRCFLAIGNSILSNFRKKESRKAGQRLTAEMSRQRTGAYFSGNLSLGKRAALASAILPQSIFWIRPGARRYRRKRRQKLWTEKKKTIGLFRMRRR